MNLLDIICVLILNVLILRIEMRYFRVNYYNVYTQYILKLSNPLLKIFTLILPSKGKIDIAAAVLIFIFSAVKVYISLFQYVSSMNPTITIWSFTNVIKMIPFDSKYIIFAILLTPLAIFGKLLFWMLMIRAILSWIAQRQSALNSILDELTEPFIKPIRKIIPPLGIIDISFTLFIFGLFLINNLLINIIGTSWLIAIH